MKRSTGRQKFMHLFISYAHEDRDVAADLSELLTRKNIRTWRDTEKVNVGEQLPLALVEALETASGFILLLSKHSSVSRWVKLELSAALVRYAQNPFFKIFPIILDEVPLSAVIRTFRYIDIRATTVSEVVELISNSYVEHSEYQEISTKWSWDAILTELEKDQFLENPASGGYGGWSKSYALSYVPIAFPDYRPETVSPSDSLTLTYWVTRGLISLQRVLQNRHFQLGHRIEKLLVRSRHYFHRHFDGIGAGLLRQTTQGEQLRRDPRHSVALIKGLMLFNDEDISVLRQTAEYALTRFLEEGDGRLATAAEVYSLAAIVESKPALRSKNVTDNILWDIRYVIERQIRTSAYIAGASPSIQLLREPIQPHMSPYYTWWVLDACGELLLQSQNQDVQRLTEQLIKSMLLLRTSISNGSYGYPLTLAGAPDLGMTAAIAEVILRLTEGTSVLNPNGVTRFLEETATPSLIGGYPHKFALWAIPFYVERLLRFKEKLNTP